MNALNLSRGLGWFSIALGLTELFGARRLTKALGMEGQEGLVRAFGAREDARLLHSTDRAAVHHHAYRIAVEVRHHEVEARRGQGGDGLLAARFAVHPGAVAPHLEPEGHGGGIAGVDVVYVRPDRTLARPPGRNEGARRCVAAEPAAEKPG